MMADDYLTDKQEAFCREYIITLNGTSSAIKAGYGEKGARQEGSRLLANVNVQKRLSQLIEERNKRMEINADYVLKRLVEIDQMDVMDILLPNGEIKDVCNWPESWRKTISSIDVVSAMNGEGSGEAMLKKIKWPDKVKNLELLGKHIKVQAFKEQTEISGGISVEPKGLDDFYGENK